MKKCFSYQQQQLGQASRETRYWWGFLQSEEQVGGCDSSGGGQLYVLLGERRKDSRGVEIEIDGRPNENHHDCSLTFLSPPGGDLGGG